MIYPEAHIIKKNVAESMQKVVIFFLSIRLWEFLTPHKFYMGNTDLIIMGGDHDFI